MTVEITDAERDLLRFPATEEWLLRRGSPLWMGWLPAEVKPVALCAPHRDSNGDLRVCVSDGGVSPLLSLVSLDLTDATGRAHLAWWMDMRTRGISLAMASVCQMPEWWDERGRCHAVLANLDPNDPRLLPDGSRLVDALALALVGRHLLAGGGR